MSDFCLVKIKWGDGRILAYQHHQPGGDIRGYFLGGNGRLVGRADECSGIFILGIPGPVDAGIRCLIIEE